MPPKINKLKKYKTMKTFYELYKEQRNRPSYGQEFVTEMAKITHRSNVTIRMWLSGRQMPDELARNVLAEHFECNPEELFPKLVNEEQKEEETND